MKSLCSTLFMAGVMVALSCGFAQAAPAKINYQGQLLNADGSAVGAGERTLRISIFNSAEGGTLIWGPQLFDGGNGVGRDARVLVDGNGYFNVAVGERDLSGITLIDALKGQSDAFLEVTIGDGPAAILPRQRILSAPYALLAANAELASRALSANSAAVADNASKLQGFGWESLFADGNPRGTLRAVRAEFAELNVMSSLERGNESRIVLGNPSPFPIAGGPAIGPSGSLILSAVRDVAPPGGFIAAPPDSRMSIAASGSDLDFNTGAIVTRQVGFDLFPRQGIISAVGAGTVLLGDGRVGIGTKSPQAPLEVAGSAEVWKPGYSYFRRIEQPPWYELGAHGGAIAYSIVVSESIGAKGFYGYSDARIKEVAGVSENRDDLDVIRQLRVKNYYPVDKIAEGNLIRKGFIAQEVREIMPEAVGASQRFVPDIYAPPTAFDYNGASKQLTISLPKPHGAKQGDVVRIFADEARLELAVVAAPSDQRLILGGCERKPTELFVYGRRVSDFLSLDYDRIFTTGISALQEVDRQVQAKDARIRSLEEKASRVEMLEREVSDLKAQIAGQKAASDRLEARLEALQRFMAEGAAADFKAERISQARR